MGAPPSPSTPAATSPVTKIIPTGFGVLGGTGTISGGRTWVLAGTKKVKNLGEYSVGSGKQLRLSPVPAAATSVAASTTGPLVLGLALGRTGGVELLNSRTGVQTALIGFADPVIDVAAGDDHTAFYALTSHDGHSAVAVIDPQSHKVLRTLPVAGNAVALVPTPDQKALYVLGHSGTIDEVSATEAGRTLAKFSLPTTGVDLTLSASGNSLYVLGGPPASRRISLVDLATEVQVSALPAAAQSVAITPGTDDQELNDFVGTPTLGNVQLIKLSSG